MADPLQADSAERVELCSGICFRKSPTRSHWFPRGYNAPTTDKVVDRFEFADVAMYRQNLIDGWNFVLESVLRNLLHGIADSHVDTTPAICSKSRRSTEDTSLKLQTKVTSL